MKNMPKIRLWKGEIVVEVSEESTLEVQVVGLQMLADLSNCCLAYQTIKNAGF